MSVEGSANALAGNGTIENGDRSLPPDVVDPAADWGTSMN